MTSRWCRQAHRKQREKRLVSDDSAVCLLTAVVNRSDQSAQTQFDCSFQAKYFVLSLSSFVWSFWCHTCQNMNHSPFNSFQSFCHPETARCRTVQASRLNRQAEFRKQQQFLTFFSVCRRKLRNFLSPETLEFRQEG